MSGLGNIAFNYTMVHSHAKLYILATALKFMTNALGTCLLRLGEYVTKNNKKMMNKINQKSWLHGTD